MDIDTNAIVVLISCVVIFIAFLSSYLEYREFLQYRKHGRKYPGGVIFDNPHEHLSGSEDYVNIFHKEFTYSLNHISGRPTYQELVDTIQSVHPYDSKEAVISYLFVNNFLPKGNDFIKFLSDVQYKVSSRLLGNILNNIVRLKLNHIIESKNFYDSLLLFQSEGMVLNGMCYLRLFDSNMNFFGVYRNYFTCMFIIYAYFGCNNMDYLNECVRIIKGEEYMINKVQYFEQPENIAEFTPCINPDRLYRAAQSMKRWVFTQHRRITLFQLCNDNLEF